MPRKKRNWELEYKGIHNTPEQFYYQFGKTTLYSDSLFKTPDIITTRVLQGDVVDKVFKWEKDNKITKTKVMEWVEGSGPSPYSMEWERYRGSADGVWCLLLPPGS